MEKREQSIPACSPCRETGDGERREGQNCSPILASTPKQIVPRLPAVGGQEGPKAVLASHLCGRGAWYVRNYDSVFKEAQHIVHLNLKLRMADIDIGTIRAAIEIVKQRQGHPKPTEWQINTVTALVKQNNSVNQLPTGSGKTWPLISLPSILDVLRDNFKENIPSETRVLYNVHCSTS